MPNPSTIQKQLQEKLGTAYTILEDCARLMSKLGSEMGSSPALRKKGGLSEEQIVQFKMKREKRLNK